MSILIKGLKMPKEGCKDCPFVKRGLVFDICPFLKREVGGNVERGGKSYGCPLIELPTADEFAEDMRTAAKIKDEEASHSMMDDIMCGILCQIGYEEAVAIFDDTPKWYA